MQGKVQIYLNNKLKYIKLNLIKITPATKLDEKIRFLGNCILSTCK